jgi:N-acetyl-gamma-glutamyl-phosphate reductase
LLRPPPLALAPLVADGLVEPTGLFVDAMSGVSGRGLLGGELTLPEANENVAAYTPSRIAIRERWSGL